MHQPSPTSARYQTAGLSMPFPLAAIGLALKAAEGVPALIRMLSGDKAGDIAEKVVGAAKVITGTEDPETAVAQVQQDPELTKLWLMETSKIVMAELEAETERLKIVNETMRSEAKSEDPVVRRARPFMTYMIACAWGWFMGCLGWAFVTRPMAEMAALTTAAAGLTPMWAVALSVIGVYVHQRSKDKQTQAGISTPGLFGSTLKAYSKGAS